MPAAARVGCRDSERDRDRVRARHDRAERSLSRIGTSEPPGTVTTDTLTIGAATPVRRSRRARRRRPSWTPAAPRASRSAEATSSANAWSSASLAKAKLVGAPTWLAPAAGTPLTAALRTPVTVTSPAAAFERTFIDGRLGRGLISRAGRARPGRGPAAGRAPCPPCDRRSHSVAFATAAATIRRLRKNRPSSSAAAVPERAVRALLVRDLRRDEVRGDGVQHLDTRSRR